MNARGADDQISFGDTLVSDHTYMDALEPICRAWQKEDGGR
jgi:hypothetical protein